MTSTGRLNLQAEASEGTDVGQSTHSNACTVNAQPCVTASDVSDLSLRVVDCAALPSSVPPFRLSNVRTLTWHTLRFFYPCGNTLPRALHAHAPSSAAAGGVYSCLLLGAGDARHLLHSALCMEERETNSAGLSASASSSSSSSAPAPLLSPLDVTLVDIEPAMHARNAVLLLASMRGQETALSGATLWEMAYDQFISASSLKAIKGCVQELLAAPAGEGAKERTECTCKSKHSKSAATSASSSSSSSSSSSPPRCRLCTWHASAPGRFLRFASLASLERVLAILQAYAQQIRLTDPEESDRTDAQRRSHLVEAQQRRRKFIGEHLPRKPGETSIDMALAATVQPADVLFFQNTELSYLFAEYSDNGFFRASDKEVAATARACVNPLFTVTGDCNLSCAAPSASLEYKVHYGTSPLLGFFLADAVMAFHTRSHAAQAKEPIRNVVLTEAKKQFEQRCRAFQKQTTKGAIIVRMIVGDALDVAAAMRIARDPASGTAAASRADSPLLPQLDFQGATLQPLAFTSSDYTAAASPAPLQFDLIDTSNLSDHLGMLHILLACEPLLLPGPGPVLHTDVLAPSHFGARSNLLQSQALLDPYLCAAAIGIVPTHILFNYSAQFDTMAILRKAMGEDAKMQQQASFVWRRPDFLSQIAKAAIEQPPHSLTPLMRTIDAPTASSSPLFQYSIASADLIRFILSLHRLIAPSPMEMMRTLTGSKAAALSYLHDRHHYNPRSYCWLLSHMQQRQIQISGGGNWKGLYEELGMALVRSSGDICISNKIQELWTTQHVLGQSSTAALLMPALLMPPLEIARQMRKGPSSAPLTVPCSSLIPVSGGASALPLLPSVTRLVMLLPWNTHPGLRILRGYIHPFQLEAVLSSGDMGPGGSWNTFSALHCSFVTVRHAYATPQEPRIIPEQMKCSQHDEVDCGECHFLCCDNFILESANSSTPSAHLCFSFVVPTFLLAASPPADLYASIVVASNSAQHLTRELAGHFGMQLQVATTPFSDKKTLSTCWQAPTSLRQIKQRQQQQQQQIIPTQKEEKQVVAGTIVTASAADAESVLVSAPIQLHLSQASSDSKVAIHLSEFKVAVSVTGRLRDSLTNQCSVAVSQLSPSSLTLNFGAVRTAAGAQLKEGVRHLLFPLAVDLNRTSVAVGRKSFTITVSTQPLQMPPSGAVWNARMQMTPSNPFPLLGLREGKGDGRSMRLLHPSMPSLPLPLSSCPIVDSQLHSDWLFNFIGGTLTIPSERAIAQSGVGNEVPGFTSFKQSIHALFMHAISKSNTPYDELKIGSPSSRSSRADRFPFKVFGLNCKGQGGISFIVVVHAVRLADALRTVVLDCSVCALENSNARQIGTVMMNLPEPESIIQVVVGQEEQPLWKYFLPMACEQAAAQPHRAKCEYSRAGATIPLSVEAGAPLTCSCFRGVNLPVSMTAPSSPLASVAKYFQRAAIMPVFPPPHVQLLTDDLGEDVAASLAKQRATNKGPTSSATTTAATTPRATSTPSASSSASSSSASSPAASGSVCCELCSATTNLKRCSACHQVSYCSPAHQREHWKMHKPQCKK